jgi:glyoxylase-like metal-dependent hydrolase (beta-lactamase superfamily II)/rhodanese-related sulfurtransferase
MQLAQFTTHGLGDTSYLLAGEGEAVLVDPQRDAWRFVEAANRQGWRVTHVVETHVHNDYVSGALEAQAATGAEIVVPARGGYGFRARGVDEGDAIEAGGIRLTALATPGHTPEHLAWLVHRLDGGADQPPVALFSGGSLLVGSVGRTDLLGPDRTDSLTADQQHSLRRLSTLPDGVAILPTHGAGSFCSAGPVLGRSTTTIGAERRMNPVFRAIDAPEASFREQLVGDLGRYPTYYARMAAINRAGPRVVGGPPRPPVLDAEAFAAAQARGAALVDARDRAAFAAGHVPGSLNVELNDSFASYVGWLVPFDAPLALVLPEPMHEAAAEAATQLLRIGYEQIAGVLAGGIDAWQEAGEPIEQLALVGLHEVARDMAATTVLDVRQPNEWQRGVIPGSKQIFVADLPTRLGELPADRPVTVLCQSGHRASIAASVLRGAGFEVRLVARGGADEWPGGLVPPPG